MSSAVEVAFHLNTTRTSHALILERRLVVYVTVEHIFLTYIVCQVHTRRRETESTKIPCESNHSFLVKGEKKGETSLFQEMWGSEKKHPGQGINEW